MHTGILIAQIRQQFLLPQSFRNINVLKYIYSFNGLGWYITCGRAGFLLAHDSKSFYKQLALSANPAQGLLSSSIPWNIWYSWLFFRQKKSLSIPNRSTRYTCLIAITFDSTGDPSWKIHIIGPPPLFYPLQCLLLSNPISASFIIWSNQLYTPHGKHYQVQVSGV